MRQACRLCLLSKNKTVQFILPLIILSALVVFAGQDSIILEFGFGMIIAKLSKLSWAKVNSGLLTFAGAGLLLASIWLKPDLPQPVLWGLPSALLVLGLDNISQWKFRLGEHLGDASYSIYLIQVFTIPVFYKIVEEADPDLSPLLLAIACLIGTAIAGSLFHLLVETQIQKLFGRKKKVAKPAYDMVRLESAVSASQ